jgi:sulfonate dioxygenase
MAPSAVQTATIEQSATDDVSAIQGLFKQIGTRSFNEEAETEGTDKFPPASYPNYLPTWDPEEKYPPLEPFEHRDVGLDADPTYPELLGEGVTITHLTPTTGSEVRGIQISTLTDAGKSELARLAAERKVVAFRDQDFAKLPIPEALSIGGFFGRHHIHPASGAPKGHPEVHLVHRGAGDGTYDSFFANRVSSVGWHSDVSYEVQPPGTTFLYVLDLPATGGDTLFANAVEAYNRLGPAFQERLHGLEAVHSAARQSRS